jgi:phage-related protein
VRRVPVADEKPLHWVGSAERDFVSFPATVKDDMGNALGIAQFGGTAPTVKPWKGLGPGVLEIVESHDGNAYRAVYTVRFERRCTCSMRSKRSRRPASAPPSETWIWSSKG